ncbi:hypothetical protein DFQ04_2310 [Algoriphagus boseongensis]|uniref:Immunity protein 17 of polymorphic toxin system n=2 Tax=Algoriphagus boseongensis TaxID=1442587 RepID=A0A4R6T6I5_9BACT|nr:hypothetical protein DFQ04_2310 [Algoriphagus boseongensis]
MQLGIEEKYMNDLSVFFKILIGLTLFGWGYYDYRRVIIPDKVGFHKFNFKWKFKRNAFIYALMVWGVIMVGRELIIWIWF